MNLVNLLGHEAAIQHTIHYLESNEAIRSIETNAYWPKWNSPWWHMTLLNEMGLATRIPERAIRKMIDRLKASPLTIFPIHPGDVPEGIDLFASHCHCGLGNIYQALAASGLDIDRELPWIREWFLRYQLPDGGLNCDEEAYLKDPPPSSIVATISPLEAVLLHTSRPFTQEEEQFLDRGAACLLKRKLKHATSSPHNAEEKEDEEDWLQPCFPRFYFYDVLRGLYFVLKWADLRNKSFPYECISDVIHHLEFYNPGGQIRIERHAYEGVFTKVHSESWDWNRRQPASHFSILDQVSQIGKISPYLTTQWTEARELLSKLKLRGLLQ